MLRCVGNWELGLRIEFLAILPHIDVLGLCRPYVPRISLKPATTALGAAVLGALDHLESLFSSLVSADRYSFKLALSYY